MLFWIYLLFSAMGTFSAPRAAAPAAVFAQPAVVAVHIEIIADSANVLRADVTVPRGTPARDLMNRLFQMEYADRRKSFVIAIAGFRAEKRKRQYWALSIDGEYARVGIAEIQCNQPLQIRWERKAF